MDGYIFSGLFDSNCKELLLFSPIEYVDQGSNCMQFIQYCIKGYIRFI